MLFYLALFSLRWLVDAVLNFLGRGDALEELHPIHPAEALRREILIGASMVSKWVKNGFDGDAQEELHPINNPAEELRKEILIGASMVSKWVKNGFD